MIQITGFHCTFRTLASAVKSHSAQHALGPLGTMERIARPTRKSITALQWVQSGQSRIHNQAVPHATRYLNRLTARWAEVFQQTPMLYAGEDDRQMPR
jgi:hypothetical protein